MDPYKILGISYDATEEEIKKAYRALSRKYHPDANVGKPNQKELEEKFKEVQQAYSMIMDQRQGKGQAQQAYSGAGSGGYGGNAWNPFGSEFWGFGGQGDPSGGSGYQQQEEKAAGLVVEVEREERDVDDAQHHLAAHELVEEGEPAEEEQEKPAAENQRRDRVVLQQLYDFIRYFTQFVHRSLSVQSF